MTKRRILLVDAEVRSARLLEGSLRRAGLDVVFAPDGQEALARLEEGLPDLLLTDTQLPNLDGFALMRKVRDHPSCVGLPILVLAATPEARARALALEADDAVVKPASLQEVVARVQWLLLRRVYAPLTHTAPAVGADERFEGSLAECSLFDLIQSFERGKKSGTIFVDGESQRGNIYLRDGRPIDAELGKLRGEEAVYRSLAWQLGDFEVEYGSVQREETIQKPLDELLIEGSRRATEWCSLVETLPSLQTVFRVDRQRLAERQSAISDDLMTALRLFDGRRTLREVVDESPFDDLSTLAMISGFLVDGVLSRRRGESVRPGASFGDDGVRVSTVNSASPSWTGPLPPVSSSAPPVVTATPPPAVPTTVPTSAPPPASAVGVPRRTVSVPPVAAAQAPVAPPVPPPVTQDVSPAPVMHDMARAPAAHGHAPHASRHEDDVPAGVPGDLDTWFEHDDAHVRAPSSRLPRWLLVAGPAVLCSVLAVGLTLKLSEGKAAADRTATAMTSALSAATSAAPAVSASAPSVQVPPPAPPPPATDPAGDGAVRAAVAPTAAPPPAVAPAVAVPAAAAPVTTPAPPPRAAAAPAPEIPAAAPPPAAKAAASPEPAVGSLTMQAQRALQKGETGRAVDLARRATQSDPGDPEAWLTLGGALDAAGQHGQARSAYKSCVNRAKGSRVDECKALVGE